MKEGKLSEVAFNRSVLPYVKRINAESDSSLCMKTVVLTGNEEGLGYLAAVRALNALAAGGTEALEMAIAISLPENFPEDTDRFKNGPAPSASENAVKEMMADLEKALNGKNIRISDVAAEVTKNSQITVSVTAIGQKKELKAPKGHNLVMVGLTGAAGSAMLSIHHKDRLNKVYTKDFLSGSDRLMEEADVTGKVQRVLEDTGFETFIEPVTDSGVFGAIWTLCQHMDCGCEVDIKAIPIKQATVEVAEFFDINPYLMRGDGAFLYITDKEAEDISEGVVIGRLNDSADRVVVNGETRSFLTPVKEDTYYLS